MTRIYLEHCGEAILIESLDQANMLRDFAQAYLAALAALAVVGSSEGFLGGPQLALSGRLGPQLALPAPRQSRGCSGSAQSQGHSTTTTTAVDSLRAHLVSDDVQRAENLTGSTAGGSRSADGGVAAAALGGPTRRTSRTFLRSRAAGPPPSSAFASRTLTRQGYDYPTASVEAPGRRAAPSGVALAAQSQNEESSEECTTSISKEEGPDGRRVRAPRRPDPEDSPALRTPSEFWGDVREAVGFYYEQIAQTSTPGWDNTTVDGGQGGEGQGVVDDSASSEPPGGPRSSQRASSEVLREMRRAGLSPIPPLRRREVVATALADLGRCGATFALALAMLELMQPSQGLVSVTANVGMQLLVVYQLVTTTLTWAMFAFVFSNFLELSGQPREELIRQVEKLEEAGLVLKLNIFGSGGVEDFEVKTNFGGLLVCTAQCGNCWWFLSYISVSGSGRRGLARVDVRIVCGCI